MRTKRTKRSDYTAIKRKLFVQTALLAFGAVAAVFIFRILGYEKLGDIVVDRISRILRLDWSTSASIYLFGIRIFLGVIMAVLIATLFLILFRLLLNSFTGYFDEIVNAIDQLENSAEPEIQLSPELAFVENSLHKLYQTLQRRDSEAQTSERRRNELAIYSAHDIKTPLTSVLGYLTLLDGNPDLPEDKRAAYTGIALNKTRELDAMINELFEIIRYNLHDIELEKEQIDLYSMFTQMREEHYPLLKSGGKQVVINADEDVTVFGDADKLARAFNNLLKNAVLYSDPDSVIDIEVQETQDAVTITFRNKCRPVPPEKLKRLFEPFYRVDKSGSEGESGTGIGLAVTEEIVLLHGGTVNAESYESGISFIVRLPVTANH